MLRLTRRPGRPARSGADPKTRSRPAKGARTGRRGAAGTPRKDARALAWMGRWRRRLVAASGAVAGGAVAWWVLGGPGLWIEGMRVPLQSVRLEGGVDRAGVAEVGAEGGASAQISASPRGDWARELAGALDREGFDSYVFDDRAASPQLRYKVRVRPAADETLEELAERLKRAGRSTWIPAP